MRTRLTGLWSWLITVIVIALSPALPSAAQGTVIPGAPVRPYVSQRAADYAIIKWKESAVDSDLVTRYEIRYSPDSGANWTIVDHADLVSLSHKLEGLSAGISYAIEMRSSGVIGNSAWIPALSRSAVMQMDIGDMDGFSCVVVIDGRVKCWNNLGPAGQRVASLVPNISTATQVTTGQITWGVGVNQGHPHHCALLSDHTINCFGYNSYGQLGDGTTTFQQNPVKVLGISNAVQVSAGGGHSCALLSDGSVQCWGALNFGGSSSDFSNQAPNSTPTAVSGISRAVQISAGTLHTCAVISDGSVQCWGGNANGELGDGTTQGRATPVKVLGITSAVQVSAGGFHTCVLLVDETVECWGASSKSKARLTPESVSGVAGVQKVSSGFGNSCAVLVDQSVQCWPAYSLAPSVVQGVSTAVQVSPGAGHSCAVLASGIVKCWGSGPTSFGWGSGPTSIITAEIPGAPSSLGALSRTVSSFDLGWTTPDADGLTVDNYKIEWSKNETSWSSKEGSGTSAALTGLSPATSYQVRVSAHSDAGWGEPVTSTFTTLPVLIFTSGVKVNGVATVGKSITALPGTWVATPKATFTYQWYSCAKPSKAVSTSGKVSTGCKAASGANKSSLKLTKAHKKLYMSVLVTGKNTAGTKKVFTATVGPVK